MLRFIDRLPWSTLLLMSFTLGLAPFAPPHIWEKLVLLSQGALVRPIDWFDFLFHGAPWLLLALKVTSLLKRKFNKVPSKA